MVNHLFSGYGCVCIAEKACMEVTFKMTITSIALRLRWFDSLFYTKANISSSNLSNQIVINFTKAASILDQPSAYLVCWSQSTKFIYRHSFCID